MFSEELQRLKEEKKLVSVYTNVDDTDKFAAGYVVGVSEQEFILASVTSAGEYDGFLLKQVDSVYKISTDGLYIDKLLKLISLNKTQFSVCFDGGDLFRQILTFAQNNHAIVSLELMNSGYDDCVGFVESLDEGLCRMQEVNEFGEPDGVSVVKLSCITTMSCDDSDDRPLKLLYETR